MKPKISVAFISYEKLLGNLPSGRGRQAPESVLHLDYKHSYFRQTDEYEKADCLSAIGISADGDCGTGDAL